MALSNPNFFGKIIKYYYKKNFVGMPMEDPTGMSGTFSGDT